MSLIRLKGKVQMRKKGILWEILCSQNIFVLEALKRTSKQDKQKLFKMLTSPVKRKQQKAVDGKIRALKTIGCWNIIPKSEGKEMFHS